MKRKRWGLIGGVVVFVGLLWTLTPEMEPTDLQTTESAQLEYNYTDTQALEGVYNAIEENESPIDRLAKLRWVALQTMPSEVVGHAYLDELIDFGTRFQSTNQPMTDEESYMTYYKVFYVKEMALRFEMPGAYEYANLLDVYLSGQLKDEHPMSNKEFEEKLVDYLPLVTETT